MKYKDYTALDFANDSFFIRWVKNPDQESDWFWTCFLKEHPGSSRAVEEARMLISSLSFERHSPDDEAQERVRNNLLMMLRAEKEELKENSRMAGIRGRYNYAVWLRAAAVVIITSFIAWSALRFIKRDEALSSIGNHPFGRIEKGATAIDEKTVVFLYDGTKVWLNADSRLTYPGDLGKRETRDVYLEGEAFFDVAPNASKPFIVHTSSIRIKVMGTSFNVKSYRAAKTVETALVEGKVRIEQSNVAGKRIGDVELKPNQLAVFDKESKVINIKEIVAEKSGAWKEDRLVFDAQPMDYVIHQLEKWYGVDIHIPNADNLSCKLTASIEKESLAEILKLIEASHNVAFRIEGKDVFMDGTLCEIREESNGPGQE